MAEASHDLGLELLQLSMRSPVVPNRAEARPHWASEGGGALVDGERMVGGGVCNLVELGWDWGSPYSRACVRDSSSDEATRNFARVYVFL
jgi:hypothetical protein